MFSPTFNETLQLAFECLENKGTILYPTDTIWGIGCKTNEPSAIANIYALKNRPDTKSFIILVDTLERLQYHVPHLSESVKNLIAATERPTSIVYYDALHLPQNLLAEDGSIAIRLVKQEFCQSLIDKMNAPLVSTSANVSGEPSANYFKDISPVIKDGVDYIVNPDLFPDQENPQASQILRLEKNGDVTVLRA